MSMVLMSVTDQYPVVSCSLASTPCPDANGTFLLLPLLHHAACVCHQDPTWLCPSCLGVPMPRCCRLLRCTVTHQSSTPPPPPLPSPKLPLKSNMALSILFWCAYAQVLPNWPAAKMHSYPLIRHAAAATISQAQLYLAQLVSIPSISCCRHSR